MKKYIGLALSVLLYSSCATTNKISNEDISLQFLDEYVVPNNFEIENSLVGGLSGIDYENGYYYLIVDQPSRPRLYKAKIELSQTGIDTIVFKKMLKLDNSEGYLKSHVLDMEALRYDPENENFTITSEGSIKNNANPGVFTISKNGKFISNYQLKDYFTTSGEQKPRNNGVFEGLSRDLDHSGYWVGTELPLEKDGPKPKLFPTKSMVRITHYNSKNLQPDRQFAYKLDGITKIPFLYFAVNGLTDVLQYDTDKFLVLERAYSAGNGTHGNTIKIFDVDASKASNTLSMENLRKADYQPAEKKLIFNFKSVKEKLTDEIIDNIEGMTFGPVLPNGKQSLILVADNNFSSYGRQLNQFLLLQVDFKQMKHPNL